MTDTVGPARWPQLALRLFPGEMPALSSFHPGSNPEVPSAVGRWVAGEGPWCVLLWGGSEVGKSYLLQGALAALEARACNAMYLPLREAAPLGPELLEGLASLDALCLDDVDAVAGDAAWNEALFVLYNQMQAAGRRLLLATAPPPRDLPLVLPDLRSRLAGALVYHVLALDDDARGEALVAAAARRGMQMPEAVCTYLLRRLPRRWQALTDALVRLDRASLSAGRLLTVPFVREVLALDD